MDSPDVLPRGRRHGLSSTAEWVVIVVAALAVALVIKTFVVQAFYIPSSSMESTLNIGDRVLVNKLSYRFHDIHRGDIVVFTRPPAEQDPKVKDLIKRVVGLPGDTLQSRDGHMMVNGQFLKEPYLGPQVQSIGLETPTRVPPGHYFVMGDNRFNSRDSRFFGPIAKNLVVGRAFIRVWPIGSISLL